MCPTTMTCTAGLMGITTTMITRTVAAGAAGEEEVVCPAVRCFRSRPAAPRIHRWLVDSDRPEDRPVVPVLPRALWCVLTNRNLIISSLRIGV